MERVPRVVYTNEFKEEAVKMVTQAGLSISEAARRGISQQVNDHVLDQTG